MSDDIGRVVIVENREYVLVSRMNYEDDTYVYLMSADKPLNVLIAKEQSTSPNLIELVVIKDEHEKRRIYDLFIKFANLGLL